MRKQTFSHTIRQWKRNHAVNDSISALKHKQLLNATTLTRPEHVRWSVRHQISTRESMFRMRSIVFRVCWLVSSSSYARSMTRMHTVLLETIPNRSKPCGISSESFKFCWKLFKIGQNRTECVANPSNSAKISAVFLNSACFYQSHHGINSKKNLLQSRFRCHRHRRFNSNQIRFRIAVAIDGIPGIPLRSRCPHSRRFIAPISACSVDLWQSECHQKTENHKGIRQHFHTQRL